ncbi:enolase C-terminal domain-like protein [Gordonia liuliyuniae]|uniref:Mandelate racemase n=1 Tax=Gordonia liuliyuniae TaxID=2911517 RepID=A0ABS9IQI2_9ACTN|nr:enolase C-terminal domain-like protein [Gordonia liuliyuniae]MCF8587819.1 mandelate racemase [Gordonia liuliyuniae]
MPISLRTVVHRFPTPHPEADGTLRWDSTTAVAVTVVNGDHQGFGWTYSHAAAAEVIDTVLRRALDEADVSEPVRCWRAMVDACRNIGATGLVMQAISAVDVALWDLHAQTLGVSLPRLWGRERPAIPVYGSGGFVNEDADTLAANVGDWARSGCAGMKIKIGEAWGSEIGRDLDRARLLTELAPAGVDCMVDANGAYTRGQAVRVGRALDRLGITWFEEPVTSDDVDGLRGLRDRLDCDVTAGEYSWTVDDTERISAAVDCVQLDVTRCGGYTGWFRAAAVAKAHHLQVSAHCAPALHTPVAAATPNLRHIEYFVDHARLEPALADGVPRLADGVLVPNTGPGHGLTAVAQ